MAWNVELTARRASPRLAVSQPNVSRIEREDELQLSTLHEYVSALGGYIEVRAVIGDVSMIIVGEDAAA